MAVGSARRPWWQQATAVVTVSAGGVITGLNFAPGSAATLTTPNGVPMHLLALERSATGNLDGLSTEASGGQSGDAALRPAIVNIARHYLQLAKGKTHAETESLIWGSVSTDGADHGPFCAAFASLTLELAAQAVGQQSWVTGGGSYPWPVHAWADVRVDPNSSSMAITSMLQDAQAHDRWHPLGDGYVPQPGDWVLFDEHVEVVTSYSDGVLHTIGANAAPDFTVDAHSFGGSLATDGVVGFIDNGHLASATGTSAGVKAAKSAKSAKDTTGQGTQKAQTSPAAVAKAAGQAAIPGLPASGGTGTAAGGGRPGTGQPTAQVPGTTWTGAAGGASGGSKGGQPKTAPRAAGKQKARKPAQPAAKADIPGLVTPSIPQAAASPAPSAASPSPAASPAPASGQPSPKAPSASTPSTAAPSHGSAAAPYGRHSDRPAASTPGTSSQQTFISAVAPGAMAAQQRWGVPAAVTIAQAIEESAWGQSSLAATYHNLFGIKGTGPAGSALLPTQEFENGEWVTINAPFRVYHNDAESISDHAELLATSGYYTRAMADRDFPDAFANDLTGVYATDPNYGANLIALMKLYNLYQYDVPTAAKPAPTPTSPTPASPTPTPSQAATPAPSASPRPSGTPSAPTAPSASASPASGSSSASGTRATPGPGSSAARPASSSGAARAARSPGSSRPAAAGSRRAAAQASIPGLPGSYGDPASYGATAGTATARQPRSPAAGSTSVMSAQTMAFVRAAPASQPGGGRRAPARTAERFYDQQLPDAVRSAFFTAARTPIARAEPMYKDIASQTGISWKLLAACDWMQCQAQPHLSPVHGERLGSLNADGTAYATKSAALAQCATDLIELAFAVYGIDLTVPRRMSVREIADVFAAFRWGGLLRKHRVSSLEFPYSVEGLTEGHMRMRWPAVNEPNAPDKPGTKFRMPFGAVPVVLSMGYRATVLSGRGLGRSAGPQGWAPAPRRLVVSANIS